MKATTEELRQGDKVTGTVTTIVRKGCKIELRSFNNEGEAMIVEIARRINAHDQLVAALKDARPYIDNARLRIAIGAALADAGEA